MTYPRQYVQYVRGFSESDDDDDVSSMSGMAVAVEVGDGEMMDGSRTAPYRRRNSAAHAHNTQAAAAAVTAYSLNNPSTAEPSFYSFPAYSRWSTTGSSSLNHLYPPPSRQHRCCCLSFRATPTRSLHLRFLKALGWTLLALIVILLIGSIFEPLFIQPDGWMDCTDQHCTKVKPASKLKLTVDLPLPTPQSTQKLHVDLPVPGVNPDTLLVSALRHRDVSDGEVHAIQNPEFFKEWHERTVTDFLDRKKIKPKASSNNNTKSATSSSSRAQLDDDPVSELTRASDADDSVAPFVSRRLYGRGSIHTDASRTREVFDSERKQLEKSYLDLVPWLPHHMRLQTKKKVKDVKSGQPTTETTTTMKTTKPLLTRASLDATTAFLTANYPGCLWMRVWIVDSNLYIHSFNTRKVDRQTLDDPKAPTSSASAASSPSSPTHTAAKSMSMGGTNPTNVFGYESSRLNHFLMMLLHVVRTSYSTRLTSDASFHDLPPQPPAATGSEDAFPNTDALFVLGDQPCVNMTNIVEQYENISAFIRKEHAQRAKKNEEQPATSTQETQKQQQQTTESNNDRATAAPSSTSTAAPIRPRTVRPSSSPLASFIAIDESMTTAEAKDSAAAATATDAIDVSGDGSDDAPPAPTEFVSEGLELHVNDGVLSALHGSPAFSDPIATEPTASSTTNTFIDRASGLLQSILSFQTGYGDDMTKPLLVFPRMLSQELSERERVLNDIRRGIYPKPPQQFAPIFTIRQPSAAMLPPPILPTLQEEVNASPLLHALPATTRPSLFNLLFSTHQTMLHSPSLLLPDFTRWSELVTMEAEDRAISAALRTPKSAVAQGMAQEGVRESGGLEEEVADLIKPIEDVDDQPHAHPSTVPDAAPTSESDGVPSVTSDPVDLLKALKRHELHRNQISHLRSAKRIMLILQPLPVVQRKQLQDELDELEIAGLAHIDTRDIHGMGEPGKPSAEAQGMDDGKARKSTGGSKKMRTGLSLQQRMLRKLHVLLKHRLVHIHDYPTEEETAAELASLPAGLEGQAILASRRRKRKLEGEILLKEIMSIMNDHFIAYSILDEQRAFEQQYSTGFKLFDAHSIVPPSCHLPLVVYEETAVNAREDGGANGGGGGRGEPAGTSTSSINALPGSWAQWLWTCDYLVLREVRPTPQLDRQQPSSATASESSSSLSSSRRSSSSSRLPPLLLPASNSFDEYWSVTYEPYKHYLPFVLHLSEAHQPEPKTLIEATEQEKQVEQEYHEIHAAAAHAAIHASHDPTAQGSHRSVRHRLMASTVPTALHKSSTILHLLPLLHELFRADWTLLLDPQRSHAHSTHNPAAAKMQLHEATASNEHEQIIKNTLEKHQGKKIELEEESVKGEDDGELLTAFEARHSCSSHFTSLVDSLRCLWCLRVTSRHWMRTVMSPEYITGYMHKLFTLYTHSLADAPTKEDVKLELSAAHAATNKEDGMARGRPMTKIKTQSDVREFIKQLVFNTGENEE